MLRGPEHRRVTWRHTQNIALKVTSSGEERLTILCQQLEANFAYAQQHGADFARPTNHRGHTPTVTVHAYKAPRTSSIGCSCRAESNNCALEPSRVVITRCHPGAEAPFGAGIDGFGTGCISCQVPVDCSFCSLASNLASQVNPGVEHTMA